MKKIIFAFLIAFAFSSIASAKVVEKRANVKTKGDYLADGFFNVEQVTRPEGMTLEEYSARKRSRMDRRAIRQDQKAGTYKSEEQRFKEMDKDEDGFVTKQEMSDYISKVREKGDNFY